MAAFHKGKRCWKMKADLHKPNVHQNYDSVELKLSLACSGRSALKQESLNLSAMLFMFLYFYMRYLYLYPRTCYT